VYDSWVYERFCCSTIEESIPGSSLFGHLYDNRHFHCSVSGDIYRCRSTGLGESYSTQASAKSCSPSSSLMSLINSSFSSSVIPFTLDAMLVTDWKSLSSVPTVDRSSMTELKALLMQGLFFFSGQFRARCPCWEHSKHLPSCRCFCFSASVVAFRAVLISIASGSAGGSLGLASQAPPPLCPCPLLFQGNTRAGGGLPGLGVLEDLPPFLCRACVRIQLRWFLCAAFVHDVKSFGLSSSIHFSASLCSSP
jgi:hypothetical protein